MNLLSHGNSLQSEGILKENKKNLDQPQFHSRHKLGMKIVAIFIIVSFLFSSTGIAEARRGTGKGAPGWGSMAVNVGIGMVGAWAFGGFKNFKQAINLTALKNVYLGYQVNSLVSNYGTLKGWNPKTTRILAGALSTTAIYSLGDMGALTKGLSGFQKVKLGFGHGLIQSGVTELIYNNGKGLSYNWASVIGTQVGTMALGGLRANMTGSSFGKGFGQAFAANRSQFLAQIVTTGVEEYASKKWHLSPSQLSILGAATNAISGSLANKQSFGTALKQGLFRGALSVATTQLEKSLGKAFHLKNATHQEAFIGMMIITAIESKLNKTSFRGSLKDNYTELFSFHYPQEMTIYNAGTYIGKLGSIFSVMNRQGVGRGFLSYMTDTFHYQSVDNLTKMIYRPRPVVPVMQAQGNIFLENYLDRRQAHFNFLNKPVESLLGQSPVDSFYQQQEIIDNPGIPAQEVPMPSVPMLESSIPAGGGAGPGLLGAFPLLISMSSVANIPDGSERYIFDKMNNAGISGYTLKKSGNSYIVADSRGKAVAKAFVRLENDRVITNFMPLAGKEKIMPSQLRRLGRSVEAVDNAPAVMTTEPIVSQPKRIIVAMNPQLRTMDNPTPREKAFAPMASIPITPTRQKKELSSRGGFVDRLELFSPWPVNARISSDYGVSRGGSRHQGVDLDGAMGASIRSTLPVSGKVVSIGYQPGIYGKASLAVQYILPDGREIIVRYNHNSRLAQAGGRSLSVGDIVDPGQVIAYVGNKGRVRSRTGDGSHLDLEVQDSKTKKFLNPHQFFSSRARMMDRQTLGTVSLRPLEINNHNLIAE